MIGGIMKLNRIESSTMPPFGPLVAVGQGLFYLITGIWPLLSINSFQKVTGPKFDLWLVKTVGALVTVIGSVLTLAGIRRHIPREIKLLAIGSAVGFTGIDSLRRQTSHIAYLSGRCSRRDLFCSVIVVR